MRIDVLNGTGFSRVTPDPNSQLAGFSRVNKSSTDTYLSGYRLNSTDSYVLSGKAERQARREARQERREERREERQERKDARKDRREDRRENRAERRESRTERKKGRKDARSRRQEAKTMRREKRAKEGGFMQNLLETGKEVWQDIKPSLIDKLVPPQYQDLAYDMMDSGMRGEDIRDNIVSYMEEDGYEDEYYDEEGTGDEKGLFKKKSWWEKLETTEKVMVVGGTVLALDLAFTGPISQNVFGMKKKKRK